jgi:hypothetical protein
MDYNKTALIHQNITTTGAGVWTSLSLPGQYLIKKAWLVVRVQGAEATRQVTITNAGGSQVIATLAPGTAAVGTVFSVSVAEDLRTRAAGSTFEIRTVASDASALYDLYVLIAHTE